LRHSPFLSFFPDFIDNKLIYFRFHTKKVENFL
jgi:hypothetical protein